MRLNSKNYFVLFGTILFTLLLPYYARAEIATGGLWGTYGTMDWAPIGSSCPPSCSSDHAEEIRIENINYDDFDGHLYDILTQNTDTEIIWRGFVHADYTGDYRFRFETFSGSSSSGLQIIRVYVDGDDIVSYTHYNTQTISGYHLDEGWHRFSIQIRVRAATDTKFKAWWTPPGHSEEIIPADHLGYYFWAKDSAVIPNSGKDRFDFVVAGAGRGILEDPGVCSSSIHHCDPDPADDDGDEIDLRQEELEIIIQVPTPTGDPNVDWMKDDVWAVWFRDEPEPPTAYVENVGTGASANLTATASSAIFDGSYKYEQVHVNLPSTVIDEDPGNPGTLHLKFKKTGGTSPYIVNGIAIIVPYRDATRPNGNLMLKFSNLSAYHSITPVVVFPVDGNQDTTIDPIFILDDGEVKKNILYSAEHGQVYRPNYLYALSGSGSYPAMTEVLRHNGSAKMILPEDHIALDINNHETWYPDFGRETAQLDVISSSNGVTGRYRANQWANIQSQYIGGSQEEGLIDPINIASSDEWIAFQYTGSNFPEDGVDGGGESGSLAVIGVYTTEAVSTYDVDVAVTGDGSVTSLPAGINCQDGFGDCTEPYDDLTVVTLTANPNAPANFLGWADDCAGAGTNPVCILVVDRDQTVTANFENPLPIDGICGEACNHNSCFEPTSGYCTSPSTIDITYGDSGINTAPEGWDWYCKGVNGGLDTHCQAARNCGWVER